MLATADLVIARGDGPAQLRLVARRFVRGRRAILPTRRDLAGLIFQGLAGPLPFGLSSSTLLTLLVTLVIYVVLRDDGCPAIRLPGAGSA